MHDAYFEVAVSDIRGFDLGDDDEILEELATREAQGIPLSSDDWLLFGVLGHGAGDDTLAAACFARAAQCGAAVSQARYLQAHVLTRLQRFDDAAQALQQAETANLEERLVPSADLLHARGNLRAARGDLVGALARYHEGLREDPASAQRWLQTGEALTTLERDDEADDALDRALALDPACVAAMWTKAMVAAHRGDAEAAGRWLQQAIEHDDGYRVRATTASGLSAIRNEPAVARLLRPKPPPDLSWLDTMPPWLQTLRAAPAVASLGIAWMDARESAELAAALGESYEHGPTGTMHTDVTRRHAQQLLAERRAVARGPARPSRDGETEPVLLFVDREQPDRIYLALSAAYPPFLWIDVGTTEGSLQRALSEFFPCPRTTRMTMRNVARGFMGYRLRFSVPSHYTQGVEPANAAEIGRHFAVNPYVEAGSWGSAHDDDPWPDVIPDQPGYALKMSTRQRRVSAQAPGAVWSVSWRTRHSRAYISIELHHRDVFIAQVRYRPSDHPHAIEGMNATFGCDYPTDLPVDAVAALLGFQFDAAEDLQARLESSTDPHEIAGLLTVLSALRHSDLAVVGLYRRYMSHPDAVVRATVCNVFATYNYESLLEEMSIIEPEAEIRAQIDALLERGIPMIELDPYTDYELDDDDDDLAIDLEDVTDDGDLS